MSDNPASSHTLRCASISTHKQWHSIIIIPLFAHRQHTFAPVKLDHSTRRALPHRFNQDSVAGSRPKCTKHPQTWNRDTEQRNLHEVVKHREGENCALKMNGIEEHYCVRWKGKKKYSMFARDRKISTSVCFVPNSCFVTCNDELFHILSSFVQTCFLYVCTIRAAILIV